MQESLRKRLDKETLLHLSVELEMTDKAIAEMYLVDRTNIVHLRKRYGIPARLTTGRLGELLVMDRLKAYGYNVLDMNSIDKLAGIDILIDGEIRIEVKTSRARKNKDFYTYSLSEQAKNGNRVGKNRIKLKDGRTRKLYSKTCDFLIFVCLDSRDVYIVPSSDIPDDKSMVVISEDTKIYKPYKNDWGALKRIGSKQLVGN